MRSTFGAEKYYRGGEGHDARDRDNTAVDCAGGEISQAHGVFAGCGAECDERAEHCLGLHLLAVDPNAPAGVLRDGRKHHTVFGHGDGALDAGIREAGNAAVVLCEPCSDLLPECGIEIPERPNIINNIEGLVLGECDADGRLCVGRERTERDGVLNGFLLILNEVRVVIRKLTRRAVDRRENAEYRIILACAVEGVGELSAAPRALVYELFVAGVVARFLDSRFADVREVERRLYRLPHLYGLILAEHGGDYLVHLCKRVDRVVLLVEIELGERVADAVEKRERVRIFIAVQTVIRILENAGVAVCGFVGGVRDVADAEQRIGDGGLTLILRPVRMRGVAEVAERVDNCGVEQRRRIRDAVFAERHRVADGAVTGVLHAVEERAVMLAVVVLQRLYHRAVFLIIVNVAAAARENHIAVHAVLEEYPDSDRLDADGGDEQERRCPRHCAAAHRPDAEHRNGEQPERYPDDVDVAEPFVIADLLRNRDQRDERKNDGQQPAYLELSQLGKGAVCEGDEEEYQHEGVTVVKPVRGLKAVPHEVGQRERHAYRKYGDEARGGELFPAARLARKEEHRHEQQRERAACDERQTVGAYGVVGGGHHLYEEVEQVEICFQLVARALEGRFSVGERDVRGIEHHRGYLERDYRKDEHADEQADQVAALTERVVLAVSALCKVIVEKVEEREDAHHVADVEVGHRRESEHGDVEDEVLLFYHPFDAEREQRQIDELVYPHGVVCHDYRIGAERVERGKDDRAELSALVRDMQIQRHREAACARLEHEHQQQRLGDMRLGEETGYQRERAGEVVGEYAEKFPAERARP